MTAFADHDALRDAIACTPVLLSTKNSISGATQGRPMSLWTTAPDGGTAPTTAVAPDRTTAGAMGQRNASGTNWLARVHLGCTVAGTWILCDRLSHQGGLSGTPTTAQTTNLPTAALTRYTSGVGVVAAVEIYTQVGASGVGVTIDYTNQAGTGGQVSPAAVLGGTGYREAARLLIVPLAAGDTGVLSVESVTLSNNTGTAGNFGVTLFRPLVFLPVDMANSMQATFDAFLGLGELAEIVNDACLFWVFVPGNSTTATGAMVSRIRIAEAL